MVAWQIQKFWCPKSWKEKENVVIVRWQRQELFSLKNKNGLMATLTENVKCYQDHGTANGKFWENPTWDCHGPLQENNTYKKLPRSGNNKPKQ